MTAQFDRLLLAVWSPQRSPYAFAPLLWLCGMCLMAAFWFSRSATLRPYCVLLTLTAVGVGIVICALFALCVVLWPDRLQSEACQILGQALALLDKKSAAIKVQPTSIEAILKDTLANVQGRRAEDKAVH